MAVSWKYSRYSSGILFCFQYAEWQLLIERFLLYCLDLSNDICPIFKIDSSRKWFIHYLYNPSFENGELKRNRIQSILRTQHAWSVKETTKNVKLIDNSIKFSMLRNGSTIMSKSKAKSRAPTISSQTVPIKNTNSTWCSSSTWEIRITRWRCCV